MRLVALLLRALDAEKPNICPAFSTGRCCPCVRARASRPQGGQCHLEGLDVGGGGRGGGGRGGVKATGRAVGEVTVQTVHLSLRKSHSRCSNCKCHRNRLKTKNKKQKNIHRMGKFCHMRPKPFTGQLSTHAHTHGRPPGWNKPIRPTMDGKVIG